MTVAEFVLWYLAALVVILVGVTYVKRRLMSRAVEKAQAVPGTLSMEPGITPFMPVSNIAMTFALQNAPWGDTLNPDKVWACEVDRAVLPPWLVTPDKFLLDGARMPMVRVEADGEVTDGTTLVAVEGDRLSFTDFRDLLGDPLPLPAGASYRIEGIAPK